MTSKILEDLNWRYATKKFDPNRKISDSDLDELLEALRLSASSFGLQPWKFIVVTDREIRERLREHSWGQSQVTDASHLIVLCINKNVDEKYVRKYVEHIAKTRGVSVESLSGYEEYILGAMNGKSTDQMAEWSCRQVYIALGTLLTAAAAKRIDACPMEGFDHDKYDEILDLDRQGLSAVVLCPVGYRGNDESAAKKKVRFDRKDVFVFVDKEANI